DCFRLLRAFRADPNQTDTNGNTVLHLTVIHDLPEMFTLAYNSGASLSIRNNLKLTPLALAARLANKRMFSLLLECEMDIVWRYGNIVCKAYPLVEIDSIREEDGGLNPCSVLANVVYGYEDEEEADNLFTNISYFDDVIITVQQLAYFESGRNEPLQPQCHLWNYRGRKQMVTSDRHRPMGQTGSCRSISVKSMACARTITTQEDKESKVKDDERRLSRAASDVELLLNQLL
ncbi:ankyrin repeat protein, partial [Teladorsagia circumcincta]